MKKTFGLAVVVAAVVLGVSPASASTVYDWSSSIPILAGGTITGSGQLVADDSPSLGWDGSFTGLLVTSITGTYGGSAITGLAPVNTLGGNDNLIFTSDDLLDADGIAFNISPSILGWGDVINVFHSFPGFSDLGPTDTNGTFTLTVAATVPEPSTVSLLAVGLLAGIGLRRRLKPVAPPKEG